MLRFVGIHFSRLLWPGRRRHNPWFLVFGFMAWINDMPEDCHLADDLWLVIDVDIISFVRVNTVLWLLAASCPPAMASSVKKAVKSAELQNFISTGLPINITCVSQDRVSECSANSEDYRITLQKRRAFLPATTFSWDVYSHWHFMLLSFAVRLSVMTDWLVDKSLHSAAHGFVSVYCFLPRWPTCRTAMRANDIYDVSLERKRRLRWSVWHWGQQLINQAARHCHYCHYIVYLSHISRPPSLPYSPFSLFASAVSSASSSCRS